MLAIGSSALRLAVFGLALSCFVIAICSWRDSYAVSPYLESRLARLEDALRSIGCPPAGPTAPRENVPSEGLSPSGDIRTPSLDGIEAEQSELRARILVLEGHVDSIRGSLRNVNDFRGQPPAWPELLALGREATAERMRVLQRVKGVPVVEVLTKYGHPTRIGADEGMWRFVYQLSSEDSSPCVVFYIMDGMVADLRISNL